MWDGAFAKSRAQELAEHFDVENVSVDEVIGMVSVTIRFHKSPDKAYVFEIPEEDWDADKEIIAKEILRELAE